MNRFFRALGRFVVRHPVAIILFYVLLAGLSAWSAGAFLRLRAEQNDLVGADLEYNRRYLEFLREFGDLEFIYLVIEVGDDPDTAMRASDAAAEEISRLSGRKGANGTRLVESVFHRVPPEDMRFGVPIRDYEDLKRLLTRIRLYKQELVALAGVSRFDELFALIAGALRPEFLTRSSDDGLAGLEEEIGKKGFGILDGMLASLEGALRGEPAQSLHKRLADALELSPRERGYLSTSNGRVLLVEVLPSKDLDTVELIREPLEAIREVLERVRAAFPGVQMGLTGRPVLQADEMATTDRDMRFATVFALAGVLVLFVLFFRRLRRPFFAVLTLVVSIVLTFGVVTVSIGYLTLLSIVFAAMLVGLGIDFGIHFLARYQDELLRREGDIGGAISRSLETTGKSIGTGGVTTAAAFFTILFVDFQGLRELGFIAGIGVLLCLTSMVTLLPALIYLADRYSASRRRLHPPRPVRVPLIDKWAARPRLTLGALCVATLLGCLGIQGLPYSSNLIELQAQELESVRYEKLLIAESDFSTWFGAFAVDSEDAVRETLRRLEPARERGIVGNTESVLDYAPPDQKRKLPLLAQVWDVFRDVEFPEPSRELDAALLAGNLETLLDSLDDLASQALEREEAEAAAELDRLSRRVEQIGQALTGLGEPQRAALGAFQSRWIGELQELLRSLRDAVEPREFRERDLPYILRRRLVSTDGSRYLVYANPSKDIWEGHNMEEFVAALREVDPQVTGAPVQVYESSWRMHHGFLLAALYSLCVTFFFLVLDLRNLREALLAMMPLVVGLLWLLEILPRLGLTFNLANFFALPILIGCGIDGGVHIMHRFREAGMTVAALRTTCSAVTLSFLTTMAGFGAMSFAMHRGVASLGHMMVSGLSCILVASVVVLPATLRRFEKPQEEGNLRRERLMGEEPGDETAAGTARKPPAGAAVEEAPQRTEELET